MDYKGELRMITPILETKRLILREVRSNDVSDIFNCWMQDIDVSRYMWWQASDDIAEAQGFVQFELEQLNNPKWFCWIIETKNDNKIIGTCLIYVNDDDTPEHWDISYNLGKEFWGNGYVTEAMTKVMNFGVEVLGVKECITSYAKVNTASANVLHKLGFVDEKEIPYECNGGDTIVDGLMCRFSV